MLIVKDHPRDTFYRKTKVIAFVNCRPLINKEDGEIGGLAIFCMSLIAVKFAYFGSFIVNINARRPCCVS